ncbi:TVP38/TMEM64 family protein [Salibacterium sp. K-3]
MEENGFKSILILRLLPVLNFDLLTYICAKTRVEFWKYILATSIGTIPGSIMFGVFGSSLLSLKPINLLFIGIMAVILSILGYITKKNVEQEIDTETLKEEVQALRQESHA